MANFSILAVVNSSPKEKCGRHHPVM